MVLTTLGGAGGMETAEIRSIQGVGRKFERSMVKA
jgi:hypothetical protein